MQILNLLIAIRQIITRKINNKTNTSIESEVNKYNNNQLAFDLGFSNLNEVDIKEISMLLYLNHQIDIVYKYFINNLRENSIKNYLVI